MTPSGAVLKDLPREQNRISPLSVPPQLLAEIFCYWLPPPDQPPELLAEIFQWPPPPEQLMEIFFFTGPYPQSC